MGREVIVFRADLTQPGQAHNLISQAWEIHPIHGLVNNAAIFKPVHWDTTTLDDWQEHLDLNLTAPFLLSQEFARLVLKHGGDAYEPRRILNILDWRALRPGLDHLPYTISKAGLAALTRSLAAALAPRITVNGLALGAILPPADGPAAPDLLKFVPLDRWANLDEVVASTLFFLDGPAYITGEILHLDGGRHLV